MAPVRTARAGLWAAVHKVRVDREPSSPWRSVTRSVVHPGLVMARESVRKSRMDFSSSTELQNNGSFDTESVLCGCLSGEKNQLLIPKFIPDEARQNPPINQKLSFLPAPWINQSGWAHLISRTRPHQRNLVVASPEQSPNGVQLPLQEQEWKSLMTKYGQFEVEINLLPNQKYASNIEPERAARPTLMGVYHLLCCGCRRGGFLGLGSYGSNSCSGILTTAFLGLSSLAPSSVDPFSPHRTFK